VAAEHPERIETAAFDDGRQCEAQIVILKPKRAFRTNFFEFYPKGTDD
jgi:hypothetical protein